ncbi:MAG TPA: hypothetical protein VHM92_10330 [Allosphingosinicella sp.]|nr:hypothetical protein [Allosphingosinicella sp.]
MTKGARAEAPLQRLEAAAYRRTPDRLGIMLDAVPQIAAGASGEAAATRAAAAVAAILGDPAFAPGPSQCLRLWPLRRALQHLFGASGFRSADFILRATGLFAARKGAVAALGEVERRLLLLSLDSEAEFDSSELANLDPTALQMAFASLLSSELVTTVRGEERRNALLGEADRIEAAALPAGLDALVMLTGAWMLCSYGSHPAKHRIKTVFNRSLALHLRTLDLADAPLDAERPRRARPTIAVAAELMKSGHVQYRYFGQYLRQLRTRFRLVLITDGTQVDDHVPALFDDCLTFDKKPSGAHLGEAAALISSCSPDIVFWPSVGMSEWGPLLANLRLAPIQIAGLGHSASTFSPAIDYFLLEEGYVSDPALFSEKLILLPDESLRFERPPGLKWPPAEIRELERPLRVAVPSNAMKLNGSFLAMLERIAAQARRPLEFHFFPSAHPLTFEALRPRLLARFGAAKVHPALPNNLYGAALSWCDLTLSSFPFGGLHSVVDSLRQGLPVVAMEGREPHARTDAMLLRRLGMPERLIAANPEEYAAAALAIIDDDALRVELSRASLAAKVDEVMFGDGTGEPGRDVVDAVRWLYENHDAVQASAGRAWTAADRAAGPPQPQAGSGGQS